MSVLNAERLIKLAYKYPSLHNNWYIFASSALTVVNRPQDVGIVLHFALKQQLVDVSIYSEKNPLTNPILLRLAEDSITSPARVNDTDGINDSLPDVSLPHTSRDWSSDPVNLDVTEKQKHYAIKSLIASKLREAILKIAPISGLPKSILALTALKQATPNNLTHNQEARRAMFVIPETETKEEISDQTYSTIEGPISMMSINSKAVLENTVNASSFWSTVYGKIKDRVRTQLHDAYPDLWQYAYNCVYGYILSYTGILDAKETSLCVVCALIPQDVNPILKGHLKGALSVGATREEIDDIRSLTFDICDWSGNITWNGGKDSVAKL